MEDERFSAVEEVLVIILLVCNACLLLNLVVLFT